MASTVSSPAGTPPRKRSSPRVAPITKASGRLPPLARSLLSRDSRGRLYALAANGHLLRAQPSVDGMEETLELVLEPPLSFEPSQLVVNRNGLFAALLGDDGALALLQLPQATCPPADGATPCTHVPLAAELTAATAVVQMAWHPMSSDHLVVLTTDARLCLFNVAADTVFPEQEFVLHELQQPELEPTAFAFPLADGWGYFTVLVASAAGAVHAISPITPFLGTCPTAVVQQLMTDEDDDESSPTDPSSSTTEEDRAWLRAAFGAAAFGADGDGSRLPPMAAARRFALDGLVPALQQVGRLVGGATDEEVHEGDGGRLTTLAAADTAEALSQGTNLLAGATADGTVRIALLVGRLRPAWTDDHAHTITNAVTGEVRSVISSVAVAAGTPALALVPMDCLRLHAPAAAAATAAPPLLLWTPMQPTQLVCVFAQHVCSVRLPWLPAVSNLLRDLPDELTSGDVSNATGGALPAAEVDVLSTDAEWVTASHTVRGALVQSRPMLGSEAVVLAGASTCHLVALPAAAPHADATALARSRGGMTEAVQADEEEDEELNKLKIPPGPWQGARARKADLAPGAEGPSHVGEQLVEAANGLRSHHLAYAHHVHEELHQQTERLQRQLARQAAHAKALADALEGPDGARARAASLAERVKRTHDVHQNLYARLQLLGELQRAKPRPLNPAEHSFYTELTTQLGGLAGVRQQLDALSTRTERVMAAGAGLGAAPRRAVPAEAVQRLEGSLAGTMETLADNRAKAEALQMAVAKLGQLNEELADWQLV